MSLTYRQLSLVEMLVYAGSVTITYLSQSLNVSRKAIYDDMDSIRVWLRSTGIGELKKDSLGRYEIELKVPDIDSILFSESQRFRNYEINERHAFLLYFIAKSPELTQDELTDKLQVSRNTLQNDLQMIRKLLKTYGVKLLYQKTKYVLKGPELQIRASLINLIGPYLQKLKHSGIFQVEALPEFEALSPNARDWLSFGLAVQKERIARGLRLTEPFLPEIGSKLSEDYELRYKECLMRGMAKAAQHKESAFRINTGTFIQTFVSITGTTLDRKVVDVLFSHLEPAYYRGVLGVVLQNPILDEVKKKYFHTYQLMKMVLRNIIPFPVSEQFEMHESSYITLLILSHEEEEPEDFPITVACYEGTSVSHLVRHQLVKIGISADRIECRSFDELKNEVDFLITTTVPPDSVCAKKWLRVSPILTYADQVKLKKEIGNQLTFEQASILKIVKRNVSAQAYKVIMNEIQNQQRLRTSSDLKGVREIMLKDLITEETIQVAEQIEDWQAAIDLAAQPLLKSGKVEPAYVQAVKENILANGAYIVLREGFALPHARPSESVNELSMSLLVLKKAVGFTDSQLPVQVIVFLAAVDSSSHLNALSELIELMSDEDIFQRIRVAESTDEILKIIQ